MAKKRRIMAPCPPWSDLPIELVAVIAAFLYSNPLAMLAFWSVCRSWKRVFPAIPTKTLSPHLPLITPTPPFNLRGRFLDKIVKWCSLSVTVVYSFRPPSEQPLLGPNIWICFLDQWNKRSVKFRYPLSTESYPLPDSLETVNFFDFKAFELGRFYNLTDLIQILPNVDNLGEPIRRSNDAPNKVVLLSDMSALVILYYRQGRMGLIRLGMGAVGVVVSTEQWEIVHDGKKFHFDDIVEFKGRVLGVDRRGTVYGIRLDNPVTMEVIVPPIAGGGGRRKRFVESCGELYLVVRCQVDDNNGNNAVGFKVYRLLFEAERNKWGQVNDFGDRIFFFGHDFSFSVSTQQLGGWFRKNCIVYKQQSFRKYNGGDDDHMMFLDLESNDLHIGSYWIIWRMQVMLM